ncbi:PTS glucose transporter subunit IIA [Alkalimonas sp. MEB108]|uniref:PTS glucose transporter subunit IIA n=1 Tax=Alkalimonas cellulosilytica TaxID=3058395 RepID=A0ABU7J5M7_9GAMM|nr:PTS glucose transporter subunit IIA [Alkalimonas sp. MEB108]MEE2001312.1 PTS glucose transporter subunit IIA [Alkalimonas sp. MEB108]
MHLDTAPANSSYRFMLQAPTDGLLRPLSQHPSPVIRLLAGAGFCLQVSSQHLLSPCSGETSLHFLPHPCIRLKHHTGIQLRLDLPMDWLARLGQGLHWLDSKRSVAAGQPLLEIDPGFLTNKPLLSVVVFPHPAIQPEPVQYGKTVLALEPCMFVQLTGKKT